MADHHGAHQTGKSEAYVVSIVDDFCKSPIAPVAYLITQKLSNSIRICQTVHGLGTPVLNFSSRILPVTGNEAGTGGGVVSGVNLGFCKPIALLADTVRSEGLPLVRNGTFMEMNMAGPDGVGNTIGKVVYPSPPSPDADPNKAAAANAKAEKEKAEKEKAEKEKAEKEKPEHGKPGHKCDPPPPDGPDRLVDVNLSDLLHTAGAIVNLPVAIILKAVSTILDPFGIDVLGKLGLPTSYFGTGDHFGFVGEGILVGDNNGVSPPGILGIAMGLTHKVHDLLGFEDEQVDVPVIDDDGKPARFQGAKFEYDQKYGHNAKVGPKNDKCSVATSSIAETVGQGFGILFRKLGEAIDALFSSIGIGEWAYDFLDTIVSPLLDFRDGYGFFQGLHNGFKTAASFAQAA